jgi:hypothetical protein
LDTNAVLVDFAIEAKCYALNNGVGVRETSRLISRLRHRQFGVFVTTSYVSDQAYKEIVEDKHPIIILAATDIAQLLIKTGREYSDLENLTAWLEREFPVTQD